MNIIKIKRLLSFILAIVCFAALSGCSESKSTDKKDKELVFGTTSSTKSLDPANGYAGWYTVRYGVTETLFKLSPEMKVENWLSDGYEYISPRSVKILIKKNIRFQNGKEMTPESVKKSIMRSVNKNKRAASLLNIESIDTGEDYIIINTTKENPTLINELCDPYASIIDTDEDNISEKPIGTGPFKVENFDYTSSSTFIKNNDYWNGDVKLNSLKVIPITDSDILSMALQSGEIDAAQGLSYAMIDQFSKDGKYNINSVDTSRTIVLYFNEQNEILKNYKVREAINTIINDNKERYCSSILNNQAMSAISMFPSNTNYSFNEKTNNLTKEEAIKILKEEGFTDSNNKKSLRLVTYSSRSELINIAQAIQYDLKSVGIDVQIDIKENIDDFLATGDFDMALYSNITSSTGDAASYLSSAVRTGGSLNYGSYENERVDKLIDNLNTEFDKNVRDKIAIEIQKEVLEDEAFNFIAHMKISLVMKDNITGLTPHATDYYEFNADTDME